MSAAQSCKSHDLSPKDEDYKELSQFKYHLIHLEDPLDEKILQTLEKLSEKHQDKTKKIGHLYRRLVSYSGVDWFTIKDGLLSYVTCYWALHAALQMSLSSFQISLSRDSLKTSDVASSSDLLPKTNKTSIDSKNESITKPVSSNVTQGVAITDISMLNRGLFKTDWAYVCIKDNEDVVVTAIRPQALILERAARLGILTTKFITLLNLNLEQLLGFLTRNPDVFLHPQRLYDWAVKVPDSYYVKGQWIKVSKPNN